MSSYRINYFLDHLLQFQMAQLANKIYASPHSFYFRHSNYELWAHLQPEHVLIQLKTFMTGVVTHVYSNTISSLMCSNFILGPEYIFNLLTKDYSRNVDAKNGIIYLQFKSSEISKQAIKKEIKLQEKINEPPLDNWMLINIIKQTTAFNRLQFQSQAKSTHEQLKPIIHDNNVYRFQAELDFENRSILTELTVKKSEKTQQKMKNYKSVIKQKDWGNQYQQKFINIQTLFEHLRNSNNYEVLYSKGIIKIRNEPHILKQRLQREEKHKDNQKTPLRSSKKIDRKSSEQQQLEKKINLMNNQLNFTKQLEYMSKNLENKFRIIIKEFQNQINKYERTKFQSYDGKFADLERQLKKYFKQKIKESTENVKNQLLKSKMNQSVLNTRKSHIFEVIKKPYIQTHEQLVEGLKTQLELLDPKKIKKFCIDEENSSQITQFKLQHHDIVHYIGVWDWTQLYTNIPILFNYTYKFSYKLIHSSFNAIAIGVSSTNNRLSRSSLTKLNSISYWGDGQIWEGSKIKQQGSGFRVGELITMQVNRDRGQIEWHINGKVRAKYNSDSLKRSEVAFYAYLQMYDQGDKIQLIQFKI